MSPKFGYSVYGLDPDRAVKVSGRNLRISHKHAREICNAIKGMYLEDAKILMEEIIGFKRRLPFRRYRKKLGHHSLHKWYAGRNPVKASKEILKILAHLEANADYKGLDIDRLRIIHAAAQKAIKIKNFIPRAHGRSTPYFDTLSHVELAVEEE